jgi:hypothetical protein
MASSAPPPPPPPLLSSSGEVYGVDDESTTARSGSDGVVTGTRVAGSAAG